MGKVVKKRKKLAENVKQKNKRLKDSSREKFEGLIVTRSRSRSRRPCSILSPKQTKTNSKNVKAKQSKGQEVSKNNNASVLKPKELGFSELVKRHQESKKANDKQIEQIDAQQIERQCSAGEGSSNEMRERPADTRKVISAKGEIDQSANLTLLDTVIPHDGVFLTVNPQDDNFEDGEISNENLDDNSSSGSSYEDSDFSDGESVGSEIDNDNTGESVRSSPGSQSNGTTSKLEELKKDPEVADYINELVKAQVQTSLASKNAFSPNRSGVVTDKNREIVKLNLHLIRHYTLLL